MQILVLGGTHFVGRHLVDALRADGHAVTVFTRGRAPVPWADVEQLTGDRETGDLDALRGREWDACLDVNGYLPQYVRASSQLLAERVARYAFISTASVYAIPGVPPIDEDGELHAVPGEEVDAVTPELYGPLKVACEQEAERAFPGRALILRPGIVAGPYDPTNRFPWWVERVGRGGQVLAPGTPRSPVQLVDGRDLAQFSSALLGREATGTFNLCGPPSTFGELLAACREGNRERRRAGVGERRAPARRGRRALPRTAAVAPRHVRQPGLLLVLQRPRPSRGNAGAAARGDGRATPGNGCWQCGPAISRRPSPVGTPLAGSPPSARRSSSDLHIPGSAISTAMGHA